MNRARKDRVDQIAGPIEKAQKAEESKRLQRAARHEERADARSREIAVVIGAVVAAIDRQTSLLQQIRNILGRAVPAEEAKAAGQGGT